MNTALVFDTLAYTKRMQAAGFTEVQAEAQAEALAEVIEQQIATKRDLKEMEQSLIIKMGAMFAASIAIIVSLVKLL